MKRHDGIGMGAWMRFVAMAALWAVVMPARADYTNAVLASGPILYYRCDEPSGTVATNASGTGAPNGTYGNSPTFAQAGAPINGSGTNLSVGFNGSSQYLRSDLTGLGLIGDNYTLEFWFRHLRPDSSGPLLNYVAGRSGGATTSELVCVNSSYFGGHSNELCLVIGNTGYFTTNNFNPAEGLWYHAALTRTNSTVTLYVNGINLLSTNVANTGISPILDWARRGSDNVLFYQGDLDEIAVYPRALSQAEIQTHVAQATMQVPVAVAYYDTQIQADHPLVYYRCEESVGATIATNDATQDPFKFYSYPGTYYNGVTLQTTGPTILSRPTNNAAQFDGSNDYMKTPNLSGKLGDAYSVEFWLLNSRAENAVDITGYFFSRGAGATGDVIGINGKYDLLGHPNEVFLLLNNNKYFTNWNPPENQWMHLAFTRDGAGNVTLYKNGVSILTTNAPASGLPGTIDFGRRADNSWYLQGQMDEIAVYTNALTSAQVLAHYANWRDLGIRGTTFKFR